jgi:hypothetical protein
MLIGLAVRDEIASMSNRIDTSPSVANPRDVAASIAALRDAHHGLTARPREQILAVLADVIDRWLAPESPWFARALQLLPAATGFSPAMINRALPTMLAPLRGSALAELLAAEVGARRGPPLIVHILPGNLPGLAAIPAALSLAIGSATLLKAGRGDRVFPSLFAASVAECDRDLGACVAATYWPGGGRECEEVALAAADLVVASGDDETISSLAARARGRFIGYGHRVSFAVVAREVADNPAAAGGAAEALAEDLSLWDQRGCLSPQLCFVEGGFDAARRFGAAVARALGPLAQRLPPSPPSAAECLALRHFRDDAEWRRIGRMRVECFDVGAPGEGTVVVEADAVFRPTPLCRSIRVQPIANVDALAALLPAVRSWLEGAGLAAAPERWAEFSDRLEKAGVHRVCALGEMQRPPLSWRQGGRPRVGDWAV